ncbi:hypothetical protein BV25DRAFT_1993040 [Artomyces pyxidatus]|uniref:Uncharacterized protein n=1 Tax=Artomyces pyxidatus TaxID=48021 RepID=A0ACB8SVM1_9AGAM|nr:hypothetical protein BV25DRAFT_1993040 [Artomyces pyxidatus]
MPLASADPPTDPNSTVIAVLKAIEGLELVKSKNSAPDTFAVVLVDEKEKWKSQVIKKDRNPRWLSEGSMNLIIRPSSSISVYVYKASTILKFIKKKPREIGRITKGLSDMIEQGAVFSLDGVKDDAGSVRIILAIDSSSPTLLDLGLTSASEDLAHAEQSLELRTKQNTGASVVSATSNLIDEGTVVADGVQSAYATAQAIQDVTGAQFLADGLRFLDTIVKMIDGVADAHPIFRVAWTLLSSVYKTLKAQTDEDLLND